MTDEKEELVDKFVRIYKPTYPIVIIKNASFDQALGVQFFPTGAAIDTSGNLVFSGDAGQANGAVDKALAQAKPGSVIPAKFAAATAAVRGSNYAKAYAEIRKLAGADKKWIDKFTTFLEGTAASALAAAKSASDEGLIYDAAQRITQFAKANPAFPSTTDALTLLKSMEALPTYKKELGGGEKYVKARELEDQSEYSKAVAAYSAIVKEFAGAKISDVAKKQAQSLIDRGMPGYKADCASCQKAKKACDKHKETLKV